MMKEFFLSQLSMDCCFCSCNAFTPIVQRIFRMPHDCVSLHGCKKKHHAIWVMWIERRRSMLIMWSMATHITKLVGALFYYRETANSCTLPIWSNFKANRSNVRWDATNSNASISKMLRRFVFFHCGPFAKFRIISMAEINHCPSVGSLYTDTSN